MSPYYMIKIENRKKK